MQAIKPVNALDIFWSKNKSIVLLMKEGRQTEIKALLSLLIIETIESLNIGKSMNSGQVIRCVNDICDDEYYKLHKIDYFKLCFLRARKGFYGKQYDRADGQIIFEWLALFDAEYKEEIEQRQINQKIRIEKDDSPVDPLLLDDPINKPVPMPDNVKEFIKNIGVKKEPEQKKEVPKTKGQILVDQYYEEFNANSYFFEGIRLINYKGKHLDMNSYINARIEDYERDCYDAAFGVISEQNLVAKRTKKGLYESVYQTEDFEGNIYTFYVPHEYFYDANDHVNAIALIDYILIN